MNRKLFFILGLILAAAMSTAARAQDSVLIKASLFTHTNNDDKDWDTCVNIEIKSKSGDMIAHAYGQDCNNADGTQYKDNSDHQFDLTIDSPGLGRDFAKGYTVHMWQQTNHGAGHDTWQFNARVSLQFSGGAPALSASRDGVVLVSRGTNERPATDFANTTN